MELVAAENPVPPQIQLNCLLFSFVRHFIFSLGLSALPMATTVLRTTAFRAPPIGVSTNQNSSPKFVSVPFKTRRQACPKSYRINYHSPHFSHKLSPHHLLLINSACFASSGETIETQEVEDIQDSQLEVQLQHTNI